MTFNLCLKKDCLFFVAPDENNCFLISFRHQIVQFHYLDVLINFVVSKFFLAWLYYLTDCFDHSLS